MWNAKSWRTVEVDYHTDEGKKKRSQLRPVLNAPVIAEWVGKVLPV